MSLRTKMIAVSRYTASDAAIGKANFNMRRACLSAATVFSSKFRDSLGLAYATYGLSRNPNTSHGNSVHFNHYMDKGKEIAKSEEAKAIIAKAKRTVLPSF